jgi:nitronate monooxygenase
LHAKAQAQGSGDFSSMWAGQAASVGCELSARELTAKLANEALALMRRMAV